MGLRGHLQIKENGPKLERLIQIWERLDHASPEELREARSLIADIEATESLPHLSQKEFSEGFGVLRMALWMAEANQS